MISTSNEFVNVLCNIFWALNNFYFHLDTLPTHGRSNFRDERSSKTYERLQKKLKDRHGTQKDKLNSPPSSPQKCPSPANEHNGLVKGQNPSGVSTGPTKSKSLEKGKDSSQMDAEVEGMSEEFRIKITSVLCIIFRDGIPCFDQFGAGNQPDNCI